MTKKMGPTGSLIYEGLVTKGRNGTYRGWLAESWEPSQNGSVWTFHLVQNATWHDGTPCTCRDVKFTNDYMKAKNLTMSFVLSDVLNVTCPDPYTAVLPSLTRTLSSLTDSHSPRESVCTQLISLKDSTTPQVIQTCLPSGPGRSDSGTVLPDSSAWTPTLHGTGGRYI